MQTSQPASSWQGQTIAVAVRTAVKKTDHYSQWSNRVVLTVIPPLQPPEVHVEAIPEGYRLTWTVERPEYVDSTAKWDTPYTYSVVALLGAAESLPSPPVPVMHADTFPPAVPTGVTALATPDSIDVSWQRVTSPNLQGYYVYRSVNGGPFTRQGGLLAVPSYSDRNVEHGKTYRYAISSLSQKGFESAKSAPSAEVTFP